MALEDFLPTAILLPSLGRPQRLAEATKNIHESTDLDHAILWCVGGLQSLRVLEDVQDGDCIILDDTDDPDKRYVTRMNKLMVTAAAYRFKTVFFGSDDVIHHDGWLGRALTIMEAQRKAIVVVNDLLNASGTQAVMRTDYLPFAVYDDPDVAFHPGYKHNYADTEMFGTAIKYGQHARAMDSIVEHLHPLSNQKPNARPWDDTYRDAMKHWQEDASRFNARMRAVKEEPMDVVEEKYARIEELWRG